MINDAELTKIDKDRLSSEGKLEQKKSELIDMKNAHKASLADLQRDYEAAEKKLEDEITELEGEVKTLLRDFAKRSEEIAREAEEKDQGQTQ